MPRPIDVDQAHHPLFPHDPHPQTRTAGMPAETITTAPPSPVINLDQVLSAVRWALSMACGFAVGKGWITSDQTTGIIALAVALVPLVWGIIAKTKAAKLAAVAAIPEVQRIVVTSQTTANNSAAKVVTPTDIAVGAAIPLTPTANDVKADPNEGNFQSGQR